MVQVSGESIDASVSADSRTDTIVIDGHERNQVPPAVCARLLFPGIAKLHRPLGTHVSFALDLCRVWFHASRRGHKVRRLPPACLSSRDLEFRNFTPHRACDPTILGACLAHFFNVISTDVNPRALHVPATPEQMAALFTQVR